MPKGRYDRLLAGLPPDVYKKQPLPYVEKPLPYREQHPDSILGTRRKSVLGTAFFDWPLFQLFPRQEGRWRALGTATQAG